MKNISIDYDGTMTRSDIQELARRCIREGHNVFITTARWPDPMIFRWVNAPTNEDMYSVLDSVGIPRTNIIFTNAGTKADFLVQAKVDIHIDDNKDQIFWAELAGVKCVNCTDLFWARDFEVLYKAPKYKLKLLICGEARHGKDTMADLLCEQLGLVSTSSSMVAAGLIYEALKDEKGYKSVEECFEDRVNNRAYWYTWITNYNSPDRTKLTKKILETSNIYVGLRNPEEFYEARHLFDMTIWVDASERLPGESSESNGITKEMCDIVIENNGTYDQFKNKVAAFGKVLKLEI